MPIEQIGLTGGLTWPTWYGYNRMFVRLSSGLLACAYNVNDGGVMRVAVATGAGDGTPWTASVIGSVGADDLFQPCIAVDSNDTLIVCYHNWTSGGALYQRKTLGGAWSAPANIPSGANPEQYICPHVAVDHLDRAIFGYSGTLAAPAPFTGELCCRIMDSSGVWEGVQEQVSAAPAGARHTYVDLYVDTLGGVHFLTHPVGYGTFPLRFQLMYNHRSPAGVYDAEMLLTDADESHLAHSLLVDYATNDIHIAAGGPWGGANHIRWTHKALLDAAFPAFAQIDAALPFAEPHLAQNQNGDIFCFGWIGATGVIYYVVRNGGAWGAPAAYPLTPADCSFPNALTNMFPLIGASRTNIPLTGHAFIYGDDNAPETLWYAHDNPTWPAPPVGTTVKPRHLSFARREV